MNVEKSNYVILPPKILEYYRLKLKAEKKKNKCPTCGKQLIFLNKNRILSSECKTKDCTSNMKFFLNTVITYDELYATTKQKFVDSTEAVLKEKFNIIFNYKSASDISELKDNYLTDKLMYDDLYTNHYNKVEQKNKIILEATKEKNEYVDALKQSVQNKTGIPPHIPDDLNASLDKIHKEKYMNLTNETILTPEFDLEVIVLN